MSPEQQGALIATAMFFCLWIYVAVVNFLKQKYFFGSLAVLAAGCSLIGLTPGGLLTIPAIVGAIRLGRPTSRWARKPDAKKMAESMRRFTQRHR
jgi:hypothetical protein